MQLPLAQGRSLGTGRPRRPTARFHALRSFAHGLKPHTSGALAAHVHIYAPATAGAPCCNCSCILLQTAEPCPPFLARVAALHELQQTAESNISQHMTAFHWKSRHSSLAGAARIDEERMVPAQQLYPRRCPQDKQRWLTSSMCWATHPILSLITRLLGAGSRKAGPCTLEYTATLDHHSRGGAPTRLATWLTQAAHPSHPLSGAGPATMWVAHPSAALPHSPCTQTPQL